MDYTVDVGKVKKATVCLIRVWSTSLLPNYRWYKDTFIQTKYFTIYMAIQGVRSEYIQGKLLKVQIPALEKQAKMTIWLTNKPIKAAHLKDTTYILRH